ncbi:MAG: hypothetical protein CM15mP129_04530 [Chloroflexota bacterium]|nr:MAG: hypothetical protein CM15mP129_04530 [Chloroflexota bacterium]
MYDLDCFYDYQKFIAGSGEPGGKKNKMENEEMT